MGGMNNDWMERLCINPEHADDSGGFLECTLMIYLAVLC